MSLSALVVNPALPRAVVLGLFGGAGLSLTHWFSRRGPLIFPVYATILAALALLLARFPDLSYGARVVAALAGFCAASAVAYVSVMIHSRRVRMRLIRDGRLSESARNVRVSAVGHVFRIGFIVGIGTVASAGIAFIAV